jgi:spore coat polysaccharide biosynthesis protein SpsF (cytidylyltransferase family)
MVVRVLDRVAQARCLRSNLVPVVAAIPHGPDNKDLFDTVVDAGYGTYSGPEHDLIARLTSCAWHTSTDAIIRITGDCPLIDWDIIDLCAERFLAYDYHYCSNVWPRSYPDGLDVEIYSTELLQYLYYKTRKLKEWREDFPTYLWKHEDNPRIRHGSVWQTPSLEKHRWTVDTQEDLDWVRWVYRTTGPFITTDAIFRLLEKYPDKVRAQDDYEVH